MIPEQIERAYRDWLAETHLPAHSRRTAERNAAFFMPHLRPHMRLLDVGCGGGSITLGLANAVAPGEAIGIDIDKAAIESARALAAERDLDVSFEVGDAYRLPYEDAAFDAGFSHAVLQHLESPIDALREVRRVLKPGGVIGVADADFDGSVVWPPNKHIIRSNQILARTRRHPRIGKQLRALLHEAGFQRVVGSASMSARGVAVAIQLDGDFWARYFAAEPFIAWVEANGFATRGEMAEVSAAWRDWASDPGAFSASFWCEAIGWSA